jgi:uncharacterized protein YndB with AHSA1/START domain
MKDHVVNTSIHIDAPPSEVWDALTEPGQIKKYMFGADVHTDWKPGSPLSFTGTYQGRSYADKGRVLECVPERKLVHTYWSSMAGEPDRPENYKTVSYGLREERDRTLLTLTQDHDATEEAREHAEQNWRQVLQGVKQTAE